jgi:hypothetical protein
MICDKNKTSETRCQFCKDYIERDSSLVKSKKIKFTCYNCKINRMKKFANLRNKKLKELKKK